MTSLTKQDIKRVYARDVEVGTVLRVVRGYGTTARAVDDEVIAIEGTATDKEFVLASGIRIHAHQSTLLKSVPRK